MDKYEALIGFGITNLLVVVLCSASGVVYGTVTCGSILLMAWLLFAAVYVCSKMK